MATLTMLAGNPPKPKIAGKTLGFTANPLSTAADLIDSVSTHPER